MKGGAAETGLGNALIGRLCYVYGPAASGRREWNGLGSYNLKGESHLAKKIKQLQNRHNRDDHGRRFTLSKPPGGKRSISSPPSENPDTRHGL